MRMRFFAAIFCAFAANAFAVPISFIHVGHTALGGTLGGTPFGEVDFTIMATGDTSGLNIDGDVRWIDHGSASIEIDDGVNPVILASFTTPTRTFMNDAGVSGVVGFSRAGSGADLFNGPASALLDGWDMLSSIGPVFPGQGGMSLLQWDLSAVETSLGTLFFETATELDGSFEAIIDQVTPGVPEPATLSLVGMALVAFGLWRKRRA